MRFDVQLSCRFKRGGASEMVDATTLNLGRLGALVAATCSDCGDAMPQPGDMVNLEVLLPPHRQFGQRCLACEAVAVRATSEGSRCLIALRFERVEIRKVPLLAMAPAPLAVM